MFHNNTVKISEKTSQQNLEICLEITYPTDFCIIYVHFDCGKKVKIFKFFKKPVTRIKLFVHR